MTSRDFAFWMQGFFEINGVTAITKEQAILIQKHLNLVFIHEIDPSMGSPEHQTDLNLTHGGKVKPTLQELLPDHEVIINGVPRPPEAGADWVYSSLYKEWYDPKDGAPRC